MTITERRMSVTLGVAGDTVTVAEGDTVTVEQPVSFDGPGVSGQLLFETTIRVLAIEPAAL